VQELLGYSIAPPFVGYVNGLHPEAAARAGIGRVTLSSPALRPITSHSALPT